MQEEKLWTPEFIGMSGSNLLLFMSQYIMVAALPIFIMETLGGGEVEAGMAMTAFQAGAVTCRPLAGKLIDAVQKQRLLLLASLAFLLIMLAFCFAHALGAIYALRLLHGCIFALATTAAAAMAALVLPPARKGEGIGYFALSTNLAMVAGPLVGLLIIGHLGSRALFLFLTSLTDFIEPRSLAPSLLGGLVFFAYGGILTFIPLYAKSLGLQQETSLFFVVFALIIILTRPLIGRRFDQKGPDATVYPGFAVFALGMLLFSQVSGLALLLAAAALLGCGFGALSPAFQTLAVESAPPARAGVATATYFWSLDISVGLAALLLGGVAARLGYAFMYGTVCTLVILLTAACYWLWQRHRHQKASAR